MQPSKLAAIGFLLMLAGGTLPSLAVGSTLGSASLVSYNPGAASIYHAPISQIGLAYLTHSYSPVSTAGHSGSGGSPSNPPGIPPGLTRFIAESSYMPQSETSIAVDPSNAQHVLGGFNDGRYFLCPDLYTADCPDGYTKSVSGFTVSTDGGVSVLKSNDLPGIAVSETNLTSSVTAPGFLVSWGDPWVVASPDGSFYYSSLAIDPESGANGIMVAKSNSNLWDPGFPCLTPLLSPSINSCWTTKLIFANLTYKCLDGLCGTTSFDDKDSSAVDSNPASPYYGFVYVAWDHFNGDGTSSGYAARCSPTLVCTMISGGAAPVVSGPDDFAGFTTLVTSPDGTVRIAWCQFGTPTTFGPVTCGIRSSPAGGALFGTYHEITSFMGIGTSLAGEWAILGFASEQFRASSVLSLAADTSGPSSTLYFSIALCTSGTYYVIRGLTGAADDNPGLCGTSAIFFTKSTDGGSSWTNPIEISRDLVLIQPAVTVDPQTGAVVVVYYSSKFDSFNHRLDVMASVSNDHGDTFSDIRVTHVSNEPNADPSGFDYVSPFGGSLITPQYGDYMSAVAQGGTIWVLFTGNYAAEHGTMQTDPFLAKSSETGSSLSLGVDSVGAAPGTTLSFTASGFTPGEPLQVWIEWGGTKVPLAARIVPTNGTVVGNFSVPNVESQMYTAVAEDGNGLSATAPLGVGQVSVSGIQATLESVQAGISSLSQSLTSRLGSLNSSVIYLNSQVGSFGQSLLQQIVAVNSTVTAGNAGISASISDLKAKLTSQLSGPASALVTVEFLLVFLIVVALANLIVLLRRNARASKPESQMPASTPVP